MFSNKTTEVIDKKTECVEVKGKSLSLEAPKKFQLQEVTYRQPKKNEVRIALEGCGVCASSQPIWEGRPWFNYPVEDGNPGHEGWGFIDAVGPEVKNLEIGDRVTGMSFNSFAQYDYAPEQNLIKIPNFIKNKPFPGEPLGCVANIYTRSDIQKGQVIAIVGCGFLGLMLVQLAKSRGAKVIGVSRSESSLTEAKKEGADYLIKLDKTEDVVAKVKEITKDQLCDRVIECTGKENALNTAIEITGVKKKLIVAGFHQGGFRSVNMQMLNWRGIDMINAHEREIPVYLEGIRMALDEIQKGNLKPFHLFTHRFSLQQADRAFKLMEERPEGFIKALLINKKAEDV
ncbi:L-iditol 2-dehydrogenase [Salegentibacter salinarum]|uniref:L-iditol 2-dehydrogenase n=1 Tax=Salegentibacter salinarum TaxID=447422 RepID=A0A2N0TNA7_9FLAO|nr:zinc-binding dehydrogenase [Salegentibacter salinarum]PKD16214.1 L-iditol 2-dehydrogenase [Salegentibacter salinarum]SKB67837.1 Threonine dehydrogenase [Salegentibacter salinarum]